MLMTGLGFGGLIGMESSFTVTRGAGEHWAHPAISDARVYMRHGEALMVYDIKQE